MGDEGDIVVWVDEVMIGSGGVGDEGDIVMIGGVVMRVK